MSIKRSGLSLFLFTIILVGYQNCSDFKLERFQQESYSVSKISTDFCTTPAEQIKSKLKFLFVLDRSGSNCQRFVPQPGGGFQNYPGTDPQGIRRFPQISTFVTNYTSSDPTLTYYSLLNFSTDPQTNNMQAYTNDKTTFLNRIQNEYAPYLQGNCQDDGWTNYDDTLLQVKRQVEQDIQAAKNDHDRNGAPIVSTNYIIFFVSDGSPWVIDPEDSSQAALQPLDMIHSDVNLLMSLRDNAAYQDYIDGITLNTAFYTTYTIDATIPDLVASDNLAEQYLSSMAQWGMGTYLKVLDGQAIDFTKFVIPQKLNHYILKDIWLTDTNTVWETDGFGKSYLALDTDGDGLSDERETQFGSNINLKDSDGNGVNDFIEYRLNGKPCRTNGCSGPVMSVPSQCSGYRLPTTPPSMKDTDLDDVNDCEELLLGTRVDDPDTNKDNIPDGLAYKFKIEVVNSSNAASSDRDFDGVSDYQEVKLNSPIDVNNATVPDLRTTSFTLRQTSHSETQDCYSFKVDNMAFLGNTDLIRIYILERANLQPNHLVFRRAEVPENFGIVNIQPTDFVQYQK